MKYFLDHNEDVLLHNSNDYSCVDNHFSFI